MNLRRIVTNDITNCIKLLYICTVFRLPFIVTDKNVYGCMKIANETHGNFEILLETFR